VREALITDVKVTVTPVEAASVMADPNVNVNMACVLTAGKATEADPSRTELAVREICRVSPEGAVTSPYAMVYT
jgi:hypothetical protein